MIVRLGWHLLLCFKNFGKCPKISNTLFHTTLAKILLFMPLLFKVLSGMANSVVPDLKEQSDLGLHCAYVILSATLMFKILGHLP